GGRPAPPLSPGHVARRRRRPTLRRRAGDLPGTLRRRGRGRRVIAPAHMPKPIDVGKWFLAACLFVSALWAGLSLKDWHAAQMLAESGAGVLGITAYLKLNQGREA